MQPSLHLTQQQMTATPLDADFLVTQFEPEASGETSSEKLTETTPATLPITSRQTDTPPAQTDSLRDATPSKQGVKLNQLFSDNVLEPIEKKVIPSLQSGTRTAIQSPALLIGFVMRRVGALLGGSRQAQFDKGAEQLNQQAQNTANAVVDAGTQMLSPNNLIQAAALTAGNLYGSPMSGVALLSAVQAAQGTPIDTQLIATNAVQAYSGGLSKRVSQAMGAGVLGTIAGGAASGALSGTASAAASAINHDKAFTGQDAGKTILNATLRGAMSSALEVAVDANMTTISEADSKAIAIGKQAMRNSVLGAGNAFSRSAQDQLTTHGQLNPQQLIMNTGQGLGGALANTLANAALLNKTPKPNGKTAAASNPQTLTSTLTPSIPTATAPADTSNDVQLNTKQLNTPAHDTASSTTSDKTKPNINT